MEYSAQMRKEHTILCRKRDVTVICHNKDPSLSVSDSFVCSTETQTYICIQTHIHICIPEMHETSAF